MAQKLVLASKTPGLCVLSFYLHDSAGITAEPAARHQHPGSIAEHDWVYPEPVLSCTHYPSRGVPDADRLGTVPLQRALTRTAENLAKDDQSARRVLLVAHHHARLMSQAATYKILVGKAICTSSDSLSMETTKPNSDLLITSGLLLVRVHDLAILSPKHSCFVIIMSPTLVPVMLITVLPPERCSASSTACPPPATKRGPLDRGETTGRAR